MLTKRRKRRKQSVVEVTLKAATKMKSDIKKLKTQIEKPEKSP
jgi:hypothetical protein